MGAMQKRIECAIAGNVQGVFFRDFVASEAEKLGVFGLVKNNPDGTVAVIAEGDEKKLKSLLEKLRVGTEYSRVDKIDSVWTEPSNEFSDFRIFPP